MSFCITELYCLSYLTEHTDRHFDQNVPISNHSLTSTSWLPLQVLLLRSHTQVSFYTVCLYMAGLFYLIWCSLGLYLLFFMRIISFPVKVNWIPLFIYVCMCVEPFIQCVHSLMITSVTVNNVIIRIGYIYFLISPFK